MSTLSIDSLKSWILYCHKHDGIFHLRTILTRKKRNQDIREPLFEYINITIEEGDVKTQERSKEHMGKKLISKKAGLLVADNKKDYEEIHRQLAEFLNSQIPQ